MEPKPPRPRLMPDGMVRVLALASALPPDWLSLPPISCPITLRPLDGVGALVWCNGELERRKAVIILIATVAPAFDVGLIVALKITSSAQNTSMTGPAVDTFGLTQARALPD